MAKAAGAQHRWQTERRAVQPEAVGVRVRQSRLLLGARIGRSVSQVEIVERMIAYTGEPLAQAQWSRWELGDRSPSLEQLLQIALVTGVNPAWLAFVVGVPMVGFELQPE